MVFRAIPPEKRFHDKYKINPNTGCWEWQGGRNTQGYGHFCVRKPQSKMAHRWSYEHYKGPIPEGHLVLHACDNPPCVNPEHLSTGTQKDNMQDAKRKRRRADQKKTHCVRGHEFSGYNLLLEKRTTRNSTFYARICRKCHSQNTQTSVKRKKERIAGRCSNSAQTTQEKR